MLIAAAAAILLGAATAPAAADTGGTELSDLSDAEWYDLAEDAAAEVEATDWAAVSAADGCELVDVEIAEVVDADLNAALGAPEDLAVPVVEREETCPTTLGSDLQFDDGIGTTAIPRGSDCSTTSGPGTLCISRSGSYVTSSFRYNGSGSISAFLRIYDISPSATGCPTGDTIATSSTSSYSSGTRRSLTVYAPSWDGYSTHVWRYVGLGHYTDWGAACAAM